MSYQDEVLLQNSTNEESLSTYFNSDLATTKLGHKLVSQRGSSTLNLSDAFIGDEGCKMLAQYLKENPNIQILDLRGNNISQEGLKEILYALRAPNNISQISLEWNNIGNDLMLLSETLMYNSTLKSLDLRNNRIGPEGTGFLAKLIENNKSLVKLDLRWNELSATGGRILAEALKKPHTISTVEISGNKIPDEVCQEIEQFLKGIFSEPRTSSPGKLNRTFKSEIDYDEEAKTRIEIQAISSARTESRIKELEMLLDQESRRTYEIQSELMNELEQEKQKRNYAEEEFINHKEECLQKEMETNKTIQELETKNNELMKEKKSLENKLESTQDQYQKYFTIAQEKIQNLDARLIQQQKLNKQLEESSRTSLEKAKQEYEEIIEEVKKEAQTKIKAADDSLSYLKKAKEEMESETKSLRTQISHMKISYHDSMVKLENKVRDEETSKFNATLKGLESRMKSLEEARDVLTEKNKDLQREVVTNEKKRLEQILSLEKAVNQLREEKGEFQRAAQKLQMANENLKNELIEIKGSIEKLYNEKDELIKSLNERKDAHMRQIEKICKEHAEQLNNMEKSKEIVEEKLANSIKKFNNVLKDREKVMKEHEHLSEILKQKSQSIIQETIQSHLRSLESEFKLENI
ncbi:unnamed protein product [Blepharisma stoltei]|uniref:Leucine-rich repeat-containing protein 45 n=1 Tax=Blepharisma stoltei TaxID=1481888 RepID=A0AAU9J3Z4_9CILI|nr:unnamed protein product [Blepharisma stoltei]